MVNAEFAIPEDNILSTDDEASSEESFSAEFEDQSIAYSGVDLEQKNEAAAELSTDDINTRPGLNRYPIQTKVFPKTRTMTKAHGMAPPSRLSRC